MSEEKTIPLAVNGGIGFGAKLTPQQLVALGSYLDSNSEVEMTTFQQLIIHVKESHVDEVTHSLEKEGFSVYKVGSYVKSLRTCNFCKGAEEEGMPVAIELNRRIAGQEVPFTLRPAYTGCPNACGEPLINDIGVIKRNEHYELYIGGQAKGEDARTAVLLQDNLEPTQLYSLTDAVLELYRQNGRKRERMSKFIDRYGLENIKKHLKLGS
ncbi:nitrate/sulfite reductase [Evansella cellulosilytica]|uniref:Nitrite and sulphite reductase 4Fe-4S region n=1 Tax=Evansella cellulosilytica (strain ATCC 21833 / DSM 2522 / FERM P-1141 / JCM 9156 / N-4) TaxID=649639 RepID=E6U1W1_EVAC2|nr:nitrate/sulfite reductase [Evansella cellulosilytica]ADU31608.1 nitrite and sulphite reductase 4Fe-4S region [Evansella cellulosilytica DSM 2522]